MNNGAKPNTLNLNGATALIYAATFGQTELAKALLEKGADKNIKDRMGKTALDYANIQEIEEMIQLLSK